MPLNPAQLEQCSHEYYTRGYMSGRDRFYDHMKREYPAPNITILGPSPYDSRDDIAEFLKHQLVNQLFQFQRKSRIVSSHIPFRPFFSLSLDLIDKSNNPSAGYHYILVIIDNFSRYLWAYPLKRKTSLETASRLEEFLTDIDTNWYLGPHPIKFINQDNGSEFKDEFETILRNRNIRISKTIPYLPQSNGIIERSNGTLKRIINKLIFTRENGDYSKWNRYLSQAVDIYNKSINTSTGFIPHESVMFQNQVDLQKVIDSIKEHGITKPAPFQNAYLQGQHVRLRIPKGKLGKFDKPNWSLQVYKITEVILATDTTIKKAIAKPTRYKIRPIDGNGNFNGPEQDPLYVKESIQAIPPLLGLQSLKEPKTRRNAPVLNGYVINPPQLAPIQPVAPLPGWILNSPQANANLMNVNFLNNLFRGN
jgi:transposase InsO family protein